MIFPSRSQLASKQIRRTGRAEAVTKEGLAATLLPGRQPDQMGQRHSLRPVRPRSCPGALRNGSLCCISTRMWALPLFPSWPPHVVDHEGGLAAIGETLVAAGDSPLPSALEIPRDVAPGARARSGPRRRGEGSWLDRPDGRTERDQAGRARADGRHGVARSASHRHAPAGSRSGAAVSPSRSRWSSSTSSFPRRAARGAAAASFTPPSPRPPRVGGIGHPAFHHVEPCYKRAGRMGRREHRGWL